MRAKKPMVSLTCRACGGIFTAKASVAPSRVYCSMKCVSVAYKERMVGEGNPHWKGEKKTCVRCFAEFSSYQKTAKYCGARCRNLAVRGDRKFRTQMNLLFRAANAGRRDLICKECGCAFSVKASAAEAKKYCGWKCKAEAQKRLVGPANPGWKPPSSVCGWCGGLYKPTNKNQRFCSPTCFYVWEGATHPREIDGVKYRTKIDYNHTEIVKALRAAGVGVLDTSGVGRGAPDILAAKGGYTAFLEVKNPNSSYGRAGLNRYQQKFADGWQGDLFIVKSAEEALAVFDIGDEIKPKNLSGFGRLSEGEQYKLIEEGFARAQRVLEKYESQQ